MRNLLHFGLFALTLTVVTQADAQDRRRVDRHTTVVVAPVGGPYAVRPVRARVAPSPVVYDQRRTFHNPRNAMHVARQDYFDQREDLEQIVRISQRWERATAERNPDAQWKVNRRLDAWLEREIRESVREPRGQHYQQRILSLRDELARLERSRYRGQGYRGQGNRGQGYRGQGNRGQGNRGHGYRGHGQGAYVARKAVILDQLVALSERQVQRAEANLRYPYRLSFARR